PHLGHVLNAVGNQLPAGAADDEEHQRERHRQQVDQTDLVERERFRALERERGPVCELVERGDVESEQHEELSPFRRRRLPVTSDRASGRGTQARVAPTWLPRRGGRDGWPRERCRTWSNRGTCDLGRATTRRSPRRSER